MVHRWAGLIIKSGKLAQNWKCKVPDICDIEPSGLHVFCGIFKTLCSAHLLMLITFTFGFYLLLFIWGSKSFPERTALILTSPWWCSALHWTESSLWGPVDAASFPTADVSRNQKQNPGLWIIVLTIQPIRLSLNFLGIQGFL